MTPPTRPDATAQARQLAKQIGDLNPNPRAEFEARITPLIESALTAATAAQEADKTLLDRWNYSGLPSVASFNHAVDVANANYRRAEAAEAKLTTQEAEIARLSGLLSEAGELLRAVHVLDCGAHYCRYCPAKSPSWAHGPSCPYVESQRDYDAAFKLRQRIGSLP